MNKDFTNNNLNNELKAQPVQNTPNIETIAALNEYNRMKSDKGEYKRYKSFSDIMKEEK